MPKVIVNFRLDEKQKKKLDEFLEENKMQLTFFLRRAIGFFMDNPHLLNEGRIEPPKEGVTKADFQAFEGKILEKMEKQVAAIKEMRQLMMDQSLNGEVSQKNTSYRELLLEYPNLKDLDTYKKVEDYLIEQLPEQAQEIKENKSYNNVLFALMQEGLLKYDVRLKKLIWMVN